MKGRVVKIVILLLFTVLVNAQTTTIWKGDVYPKDLNAFLQGQYTTIEGNLEIYKSTLTNLAQLKSLKVVKGNVYIGIYDYKRDLEEGNESLVSLKGLENLTEISGELEIRDNELLENIEALRNLKNVNELDVSYNPMLKSLEGLNNLSGELLGGLQLYKNKRLEDITQLSGITLVGDYLAVNSNLSLQSLEGLHNIKVIENGSLAIRNNDNLKNLKGLRKISAIDEEVQINSNPLIESLEGLEKLTKIGKFLYIKQNDMLKDLEGLHSLSTVGEKFEIQNNKNLISLNGLTSLTTIKGSLSIEQNPSLINIDGLNKLKGAITSIRIDMNTSLKEINGLNNITTVNEFVTLSDNHLEKVTGFKNVKTIKEFLHLSCSHLEKMSGFNNLTELDRLRIGTKKPNVDISKFFKKVTRLSSFSLSWNKTLETFVGPNSLIEIDEISIRKNEKLVSLSGFKNLKIIKEKIEVEENTQLKSIEGFKKVETIKEFTVKDNQELEAITGFTKVNHIDNLEIYQAYKLVNLNGFNNVTSIGDIEIKSSALMDLNGFKCLEKVNEGIYLDHNIELTSLKGLENLKYVAEGITFSDNRKLLDYNALQDVVIESKSDEALNFYWNAYNPNKNELLINNKLDKRVIPESFLKEKSITELMLLRNEILARKGYVFKKENLDDHFKKQVWYKPIENKEITLNKIEKENTALIKKYEGFRFDTIRNIVQKLKENYKDVLSFPSDYKKYHSVLQEFVRYIDAERVAASDDLSFSKRYYLEKNIWEPERPIDEDSDFVSIIFDEYGKNFILKVESNYIGENEDESWLATKNFLFQFKVNENTIIEFVNEYNEEY